MKLGANFRMPAFVDELRQINQLDPRDPGRWPFSVRVLAVGTGQALDVARRGDADLVLVHDEQAERRFVDEGWGIDRRPVMRNDYVIVGPASDPAGTAGADAVAAMARIARAGATFVSRGDRSGTHAAELALWRAAGIDPPAVARAAHWYRESGSGMGATLNVAAGLDAYTLADRATWLAFRNPARLAVLVEGDPGLVNRYCVILVNPARHPHVKREAAQRLADWLVSPPGRAAIDGFRIGGRQVFFAHPPR